MSREGPRTSFACQECGAQSPKWQGRCPQCNQWNTLVAMPTPTRQRHSRWLQPATAGPQELSQITSGGLPRIRTAFQELDRVLGGGLVPGAVVLLAGEPGIGKSTLLLQAAAFWAAQGQRPLYVSGEESAQQVKLRAERLGIAGQGLFLVAATEAEEVRTHLEALQPSVVVVDSIQALRSDDAPGDPGSINQVRECARQLAQWAKGRGVPVLLAGHVTKDGSVAGPKVLEHMADVVLALEGDLLSSYRILRGTKNRFGATNEVGVFEMTGQGLAEVADPSRLFLSPHRQGSPGSAVVVTLEGTRPLITEVQALTTPSVFPQPRRTASGVEFQRLVLLAAVATKYLGLALGGQDIVVNVVGGLNIQEPAADLGIIVALASSYRGAAVDPLLVAMGEVGLGGEVRRVPQLDRRLAESAKVGFRKALVPATQAQEAHPPGIEAVPVATVREAVRAALPPSRDGQRTSTRGGSPFQPPEV